MKQKGLTFLQILALVALAVIGLVFIVSTSTKQSVQLYAQENLAAKKNPIIRGYVSEGIDRANVAKLAVSETVMSTNQLPASQAETGYISPAPSETIQSIVIGDKGVITLTFTAKAGNGTLVFTPQLNASGMVEWNCQSGTLPNQYRPEPCRK